MAATSEVTQSTFRRGRALMAFALTVVFVAVANLWDSRELGTIDASNTTPFVEAWELCDTTAYGWPLSAARWATRRPITTVCDAPAGWSCMPSPCEDLPVFDPLAG